MNLFKIYEQKLDKIIKQKNFNYEISILLKRWLYQLIKNFNSQFINTEGLEKYIEEYLNSLSKVNTIILYTYEDVLHDKSNHFYKNIEKITNVNQEPSCRLKKVGDSYQISQNGEYHFACEGVCWCAEGKIILLKNSREISNLHHELSHMNQGLLGYYYPNCLPFANLIIRLFREGNACMHQKIYKGNLYVPSLIEENNYDFYYQIYILMTFILPEKMNKEWQNGKFNINGFIKNKELFLNAFSLLTIVLAKKSLYSDEEINKIINQKTEETNLQTFNTNEIANVMEAYLNQLEAVKKEIIKIESVEQQIFLWDQLGIKETLEEYKNKKSLDNCEYSINEFNKDLRAEIIKLLNLKITEQEYLNLFIKTIENHLKEISETKISFLENLKSPVYEEIIKKR